MEKGCSAGNGHDCCSCSKEGKPEEDTCRGTDASRDSQSNFQGTRPASKHSTYPRMKVRVAKRGNPSSVTYPPVVNEDGTCLCQQVALPQER